MVIAEGGPSQAERRAHSLQSFHEVRQRARGDSPWTAPLLILGACIVAFMVMPAVYGLVAFHGAWARTLKAPAPGHIAFIAAANALVMVSAVWVRGRLDRRLAGVISRTLVVHGGVAFVILV